MAPSAKTTREKKQRFFDELDHLGQSDDEVMTEDEVQIIPNLSRSKDISILSQRSKQRSTQNEDEITQMGDTISAKDKSTSRNVAILPPSLAPTLESRSKQRTPLPGKTDKRRTPSSLVKNKSPLRTVAKSIASSTRQGSIMKPQEESKRAYAKLDPKPRISRCKEKGKDEIQRVPEDQRIFEGLKFFFIPNNDVTKPRKRRIQAGIARGATWERTYSDAVTHVIVDIELDFPSISKAFKNRETPQKATILKDTWLIDSIKYGCRQNEEASRYRLHGAPTPIPISVPVQSEKRARTSDVIDDDDIPQIQKRKLNNHEQRKPLTRLTPTRSEDDLDKIMQEFKSTAQYLPDLETDSVSSFEHATTRSTLEEASEEDTDQQVRDCPKENRGFQCMEKNDGNQLNPNSRTIDILQGMASYYDRTGDRWRTLSYRKGMTALRKQKKLIRTKDEAIKIHGIGERLADKIEEIVTTDRLQRFENAQQDPNDAVLQLFMGIYDVGFKHASKWIAQGHRTLDDLIQNTDLTPNQRVGIEHYSDFLQRIPRNEVAQHGEIVKRALLAVDPHLELIIGGSYRRGNTDSGDIDCLITKKNASIDHIRTLMVGSVIPLLQSQKFLKVALAAGSSRDASKWHGASCLPGSDTWRRIDLLYVPWNSLGAALIYFTGNDIFNRSMRLLASRNGWRLNQHGLYKDVMRGQGRKKITDGTLIEGHSEKNIFDVLGVPWRLPCERKC